MNYISKENHEILQECMQTATEHLREAKEIMRTLEGKSTGTESRATTARE
jgi:hypothetical protein